MVMGKRNQRSEPVNRFKSFSRVAAGIVFTLLLGGGALILEGTIF